MHEDVYNVLKRIISVTVKSEVISKCSSDLKVKAINLDKKENIVKGTYMVIGFGAKDVKRMESVTKEQIRSFQVGFSSFVASTIKKIFDKSLLGSVVVRNVNVLDRKTMLQECASSLQKKL